ncbi:MAG: adenine deaminase [Nitrospirota bacterium]
MRLEGWIKIARGEEKVDLLLKNANVVNVFSGEIHREDVAVVQGRIIGFGDYDSAEVIDLEGKYLCPGFIDGHIHLESTMVTPSEFARTVLPLGTTAVIIDPHEIANVLGIEGIRYFLKSAEALPIDIYVMLPSCVPATDMETSGAMLMSSDLSLFIGEKRVLGMAEMMNFPGVIYRDPEVMRKTRLGRKKVIDGHAPLLSGKDLNAYITAGIRSDHECTNINEAREKLRKGMWIMIREGTTEKNLVDLLPLLNPLNIRRCFFVSDDRHPDDLLKYGHINYSIKKAISLGLDSISAIQMATINPAGYFHLTDYGAIAPGFRADMVVLDDPKEITVMKVFKSGKVVAEDRKVLLEVSRKDIIMNSTIKLTIEEKDRLRIKVNTQELKAENKIMIKVIEVIPNQILTNKRIEEAKIVDGEILSDTDRDMLKIAVFERHRASKNIGIGFVKGFGFKNGAIASSVAHDSHNIVVVGVNDRDMLTAVKEIIKMNGGQVVVSDGEILCALPLPIAGLMSNRPIEEVSKKVEELKEAARKIGCILPDPFMTLSFLALPVIPELKITDKGLVDVNSFRIVPLICNNQ